MKGSGSCSSPYSWDEDRVQLEASGGSHSSYVDAPEEETKGAQVPQCLLMLTDHGACGRPPSSEWTTHHPQPRFIQDRTIAPCPM